MLVSFPRKRSAQVHLKFCWLLLLISTIFATLLVNHFPEDENKTRFMLLYIHGNSRQAGNFICQFLHFKMITTYRNIQDSCFIMEKKTDQRYLLVHEV